MIERIIEAFTRGQAFRSHLDDIIIAVTAIVAVIILGAIYFLIIIIVELIKEKIKDKRIKNEKNNRT